MAEQLGEAEPQAERPEGHAQARRCPLSRFSVVFSPSARKSVSDCMDPPVGEAPRATLQRANHPLGNLTPRVTGRVNAVTHNSTVARKKEAIFHKRQFAPAQSGARASSGVQSRSGLQLARFVNLGTGAHRHLGLALSSLAGCLLSAGPASGLSSTSRAEASRRSRSTVLSIP